jgi:hypothetical protein
VIAALIAAGGTWAAGERMRRVQLAEERRRIRVSFYLEITGYLYRGMNPHAFLAHTYKRGKITPDNYTHIMLTEALEMPEPAYFLANRDKLAVLSNPQAVNGFYNCLDVVRLQRGRPGMENIFDAPNPLLVSQIIMPLGVMLKIGVDLLESSEFAEIDPIPLAQLVKGLRISLAEFPHPFKSAADLKPQSSGPG